MEAAKDKRNPNAECVVCGYKGRYCPRWHADHQRAYEAMKDGYILVSESHLSRYRAGCAIRRKQVLNSALALAPDEDRIPVEEAESLLIDLKELADEAVYDEPRRWAIGELDSVDAAIRTAKLVARGSELWPALRKAVSEVTVARARSYANADGWLYATATVGSDLVPLICLLSQNGGAVFASDISGFMAAANGARLIGKPTERGGYITGPALRLTRDGGGYAGRHYGGVIALGFAKRYLDPDF